VEAHKWYNLSAARGNAAELERRLRAGNAELLGAVLSTGAGTAAYRAWAAEQTAPGAPEAQGTSS